MIATCDILSRIDQLPPLPDTVLRLVRVTNNPDSTVHDVVESIRYDQAVTAEILRLCNSSYFGLPRTITTLDEATRYLGILKVLHLVLSLHTSELLKGGQAGYGMAPGALWRHSVAVAIAAGAFTDRLGLDNRSVAFTAGLLHDLGKVIIHRYVRDEFKEILRLCEEEHMGFPEAENRVLGCTHADVGAELAIRWQLPDLMVLCIRYHHDPLALQEPHPLVDVVHLADCAALLMGVGLGSDEMMYRAEPAVLERNGLRETDMEMIAARMITELRGIEEAFASFGTSPARAARPAGGKP